MLPLIGYKAEGTFSDDTHMNAPDLELPAHLAGTVDDAIFKAMTSDTPDEVNHLMEVYPCLVSFPLTESQFQLYQTMVQSLNFYRKIVCPWHLCIELARGLLNIEPLCRSIMVEVMFRLPAALLVLGVQHLIMRTLPPVILCFIVGHIAVLLLLARALAQVTEADAIHVWPPQWFVPSFR